MDTTQCPSAGIGRGRRHSLRTGDSEVARLPRCFLGKITLKHKLETLTGIKEVKLGVGGEESGSGRGNCTYQVL